MIIIISASGEKLPPLLIFKGEKEGREEKILKVNEYCRKKIIFVVCQENSSADKGIFSK